MAALPQIARAKLVRYDPLADKGIKRGGKKDEIPFQFNPQQLKFRRSINDQRNSNPGSATAPPATFGGARPGCLSLTMLFDASATHDDSVVKAVEKLFACCAPTADSIQKNYPAPYVVEFHWGPIKSFPSFVDSVDVTYELFTSTGQPIRASCTVELKEIADEPTKQNPTSGAIEATRGHTVVDGDTLASVAFKEYRRPALWRPLAAFNGIDDPLRLRRGQTLLLPSLAELEGRGADRAS